MPADPDGDSEMLSSPESEKFAQGPRTDPRTPRGAPSGLTDQFPASELSPPGSQGPPNANPTKQNMGTARNNDGLGSASAAFAASRKGMGMEQKSGGGTESSEARNTAPGSSWMNKRAEEEYQRAMEYVVDREFSLREFGDPFDEREISQRGP